ncbi:hypothetical protein M0802_006337 [Mischocyttarus mexicanus]|nr:hypothetical protein M0802_006337 [Mischocyttarus mexicanus]
MAYSKLLIVLLLSFIVGIAVAKPGYLGYRFGGFGGFGYPYGGGYGYGYRYPFYGYGHGYGFGKILYLLIKSYPYYGFGHGFGNYGYYI